MKAGRELDALVAEKVMGECVHEWDVAFPDDDWYDGWEARCTKCADERTGGSQNLTPVSGRVAPYSTSIADAWLVVENDDPAYAWRLEVMPDGSAYAQRYGHTDFTFDDDHEAYAEEMPEAICLAALRAMGETP